MGRLFATLALCIGLSAFGVARADDEGAHEDLSVTGPSLQPSSPEWNQDLMPVIQTAAEDYAVPAELLITLGQLGSHFDDRGGVPTIEGGYGALALRDNILGGDSLLTAAALLGTDAEELKVNPVLNIQGAAAVLDSYATEIQIERAAGLDAWWPVIVKFAGLDKDSNGYFAWQVFTRIKHGWSVTNNRGEVFSVTPQPITIDLDKYAPPGVIVVQGQQPSGAPHLMSPDYGPAVWDPAASCNYSTSVTSKDTVIIHTAEGSYSGTISWFKNCNSNVSSHYVVAEDGRITQMVLESQYAFHASCYNSRAVGIEHEGFASSSSHPVAMYNASGDLTHNICDDHGIPKSHNSVGPGILGHIDVTNCCCGTHTDPGNGWDWSYYISRVNGGAPPPPAFDATFNAQSFSSSMTAGSTAIVWAEFVNQGTTSWTHCATKLGTSSPQDRTSPFCTPGNWACAGGGSPGCNRPTDVDQSSVATGAVGRFTFIMTAPATPGAYVEKFKLVQEGVTWFGPEISWSINVTAGQGNLTGTVRNGANSNPLSGATVTLSGIGSTNTNGSGVYTFNNVNSGNYTVSVSASGFSPASSGTTINTGATTTLDFNLSVTDNQSPSTPTNLVVNSTTASSVSLSWTASTDNVSVAGYDIRRDGVVINSSPTNSFTDMTVSPQTLYTYDVRAKDGATNVSGYSNAVQAITKTTQTVVFSDGFNGNLNNWTAGASPYTYSTTQNHGTLTGGGAAYMAAAGTSQMYHPFTRPFAQAKASGYFWDPKGGWKTGVCGSGYRQSLSLRDNVSGVGFIIDNCMNSSIASANYFWRTVGGGGVTYTSYGTRNATTDCNAAWLYFETTVSPGSPGASPTGTFLAKVIDGGGTSTTTQNLTTDFYSFGIARITLGLGVSSAGECYWDDVVFEATAPNVPTMGAPVAGTNQIQWTFTAADNNLFGFEVANSSSTVISPVYNASGWLARTATSWTETGLSPNTQYSRKTRSWNGTLNSLYSNLTSAYTLSPAPGAGSVAPDVTPGCPGQNVNWTAVGGFGAGHIQYYLYTFDQSPTHTFTGTESTWSSGTLTTNPSVIGTWYLHVKGYNADNIANGQFDYVLPVPDTDGDTVADCTDGCPNDAAKTSPGVCGCGVADTNQTSIQEGGQPSDQTVAPGGTATFAIGVSGTSLTYQWHSSTGPLSDGGKYSGTTTDTLHIANVDSNDVDAGPYHVVVSGGCGAPVTSDGADVILSQPPSILSWKSIRTHGSDGELAIVLDASAGGDSVTGPTVETRQGGIRKILISLNEAVTLVNPAVVVTGHTIGGSIDYSSQAGVSLNDDQTLQILFADGALPDGTCYTIDIAGSVQNAQGQPVSGDTNCLIRSLVGDVAGSGEVNLSDAILEHIHIGDTAIAHPNLDIDVSGGTIDNADTLAIKALVTSPAHATDCP